MNKFSRYVPAGGRNGQEFGSIGKSATTCTVLMVWPLNFPVRILQSWAQNHILISPIPPAPDAGVQPIVPSICGLPLVPQSYVPVATMGTPETSGLIAAGWVAATWWTTVAGWFPADGAARATDDASKPTPVSIATAVLAASSGLLIMRAPPGLAASLVRTA